MLPRVEDLEHSIQWTSLANDIDDLEKLRRRDRRGAIEQHTYQRASMPEMQRACTVTCDDDRRTPLNGNADYLAENCPRWSWKPRTDFEREYFYKDYKDYYCNDAMRYPTFYEPSRIDRSCSTMQEIQRLQPSPASSPVTRSGRLKNPVGLEKEHFSDSREKLHEIFEHNRYLRRQFFANEPVNARQDCERYPGVRNHQEASRRYVGFGSTETLTSQSNQSSVSSINERKSQTQATRSPEDEEDVLTELVGRNGVVASSRRVRRNDGDIRRDGKVLVNILPGNEVKRVNVRNVTAAKLDKVDHERSEGTLIAEEARFWNAIKTLDKSSRRDVVDDKVVRKEESLPKYVFGSAVNLHRENREGLEDLNGRFVERRCNRSRYATWTIPEDEQLDFVLEHRSVPGTTSDDESSRKAIHRSLPNLMILKRKFDTPSYVARPVNVPGSSDCETHIARSGHQSGQCRERSERHEVTEDPTRSDNHGQSKVTGYSRSPVTPQRLTSSQRVKASRIPPPLDLSRVNEQYERMEAEERRYLNNYSVDVAILRNHEDLVEGLLTVAENERIIKNAVHGNDIWPVGNDRSRGREDKRRLLSRPLHKSCNDLPLANELQSPQLVNNCKSSMSDLRAVDSAPIRMARRPIDPDADRRDRASSLLSDQTSSIGGLQTGSALPSTVYGPIPYSQ